MNFAARIIARFKQFNFSRLSTVAGITAFSLLLASCGGGGGGGGSTPAPTPTPTPTPVNNVAAVVVDNGPTGANGAINVPYVSVTICNPGTTVCQTIDHVLVDTGSFGLRVLAPLNSAIVLPSVTNAAGTPVGECSQFASGFTWGSVRKADVTIAGEKASSLPIQIISDNSAAFATIPSACSSTGASMGTVATLGANGILGVGLWPQDCGSTCATSIPSPAVYYGCTTASCAGTMLPITSQVANPVTYFATDNNGVLLSLGAVPNAGLTTVSGSLIFGIGTQSNNLIGNAQVYSTDSNGNIATSYPNSTSPRISSFFDSGSNGLFFTDTTIPVCTVSKDFYCPVSPLALSAINYGTNNASSTVNFTIVSVDALASNITAALIGGTSGVAGGNSFDWGLPFFYGRKVYFAIEGASTPSGTGPYYAY